MTADAKQIILTAQPEAVVTAISELQKWDASLRPLTVLSQETRLMAVPGGYAQWCSAMQTKKIIFARHIFPVHYTSPLAQADLSAMLPPKNADFQDNPFSVQMREAPATRTGDSVHERALSLVHEAEQHLSGHGYTRDDQSPAWVLSMYIYEETLYAGISLCADNLSAWNGGMHRFKKDTTFISRAEFKILEAFDTFGIPKPNGDANVLDLGAAPGGWSKALLERGYRVTAVDPAALSEPVACHPHLTHFRGTAQRFKGRVGGFELIVNDMRMDAGESCGIMLDMADLLAPLGGALMTLKLKNGHWYKQTAKALALLEKRYEIIAARQLFHNRGEVTVLMRSSKA